MTKLELIDKRKQLRNRNKELLDLAKSESRQLKAEENAEFTNNLKELDTVNEELDLLEERGGATFIPANQIVEERMNIGRMVAAIAAGGALTEIEGAVAAEGRSRFAAAGIPTVGQLQVPVYQRSIIDSSASNGIQKEVILDLATPIREASVLAKLGANFIYESGIIGLPSYKGNSFGWYAENEEISDSSQGFDNCQLVNKRLAGCIPISKTVIVSTNMNVLGIIDADIRGAISEAIDEAVFTFGAATTTKPAGIQQINTTFADAINHANILKLETAVLEKKFTNLKYVVCPSTRAKLMQTTKGGAKNDLGFVMDNGGMSINGISVTVSPSANDAETSNIFLGDFSKIYVKLSAIDILFDPYTLAKKNAVNLVVNVLADIQYRDKNAFAWGYCPK